MFHNTSSDRNQEATVWIGNLDAEVDEELLVELMLQAGPVNSVTIPRDKISGIHQGFAFVEFGSEKDADYAMQIMNTIRLIGKTLRINKASREQGEQDIGANLFVGNLDPDVDEQLLYTTFSAFGQVVAAKVMYDEIEGSSKGFGFVNFIDFNSADNALKNMNGQFLCNKPITVSFAFKKGETGVNPQKHGNAEERKLASLASAPSVNTKFSSTAPRNIHQTGETQMQNTMTNNAMPHQMQTPYPMMNQGMSMPPMPIGLPSMGMSMPPNSQFQHFQNMPRPPPFMPTSQQMPGQMAMQMPPSMPHQQLGMPPGQQQHQMPNFPMPPPFQPQQGGNQQSGMPQGTGQ